MPERGWRFRLHDILNAVAKIERYTAGLDFAAFRADDRTIDAVVRNIEIIGEAARHVPETVRERYATIPWTEMQGMRNIVAHAYFKIDLAIVWETIQRRLPELRQAVETVLTDSTED